MFMVVLSQRPPHTIFPLTLIVIGGADLWLGIRMFQSSPLISTCLLLPRHSLSSPRCWAVPKLPSSSHKTRKIGSCGVHCE